MNMTSNTTARLKDIPPELVLNYDIVRGPEVLTDPPSAVDGIREERRVFYSPLYGGYWVFTRYEDIRAVFQDAGLFAQNEGIPHVPFQRKFIPLRLNPPEHMPYRRVMTPLFAPRQMERLVPIVRGVARKQLEKIAPLGRADFGKDFALALPSAMYCGFVGFPVENFEVFYRLSHELIYAPQEVLLTEGEEAARAVRRRAMTEIETLLRDLVAQRRANPTDDAVGILAQGRVFDRDLTDEEILNMTTLLFFAGTDSTAALITYSLIFLAQHPEYRAQLIAKLDDEDYLWRAAEELTRFHGFHQISRTVTRDVEFAGVQLRKGDGVVLPVQSANRDQRHFADPLTVDLERENGNNNLTFGAGSHRCLGSHLATLQLRIAVQEIHRAIPDYRLDGKVTYVSVGPKATPEKVPMIYTPTIFQA